MSSDWRLLIGWNEGWRRDSDRVVLCQALEIKARHRRPLALLPATFDSVSSEHCRHLG